MATEPKLTDSKDAKDLVNVKGNIDPKDAMNFYKNNKQYMPSGQQMLNAAQKATNQGNNTTGKKGGANALANLFGAKK